MLNQVLYDRIISVTLYKKAVSQQRTIQVHRSMGYGETRVQGRKVLFSKGANDHDKNTGHALNTSILFYEGSSYYTYSNFKNRKGRYVRHKATGPLYKFNTMDEMKRGIHPDGSLMQTGDRAYILETRKTWTAVVTGSAEALLDSTVTSEGYRETLTIVCPDKGLKPDMLFSVNLLPGQNCYKAVLKIRNLNIKSADIRMWDKMEIIAGYRSGSTARFICPIFASYIESPNPDGITVFEGITVGQLESQMFDKAIEIVFAQDHVTLDSLIRSVADGIMSGLNVVSTLPKEYETLEVTISKQSVYAENGLAVLNWLQSTVASIVEEQSGGKSSALVQLMGNELNVLIISGDNAIPFSTEKIISLNMVSGATFNGTALTVEAPWNPGLKPGALFYMPPQFIQGSHLPNVLNESNYRNKDNLYRVLTMSIIFGTTDGNNKMSVLAVPAQYAGQSSITQTTEMLPEQYAALKTAEREIVNGKELTIRVGETNGVETAAMEIVTKKTGISMFDAHKNLPGFAFTALTVNSTGTKDDEDTGNCLSVIGEYYCCRYRNGPRLNMKKTGTAADCGRYRMSRDELENVSALAATHPQNEGIPCYTLWWPLIAVATYWRWQEDEASGMSNNWMHIDLSNPDYLVNKKALYVPVFNGYEALRGVKDIYKDAYNDYKEKYPSYSAQWRAMYYMLGGTDDLG